MKNDDEMRSNVVQIAVAKEPNPQYDEASKEMLEMLSSMPSQKKLTWLGDAVVTSDVANKMLKLLTASDDLVAIKITDKTGENLMVFSGELTEGKRF